ncbi:hypothetical protein AZE42_11680 [Rhizopogon vesiculosus]|uniref:Uncharacterized protein n=1 Tax=Rhizopogon vesiculosus TaxID=180088 RepID=A0A1J8QFC6_9AGAM|nr:hypothetical protein AZE42_11680 [Rhizopogon vesiculosus]
MKKTTPQPEVSRACCVSGSESKEAASNTTYFPTDELGNLSDQLEVVERVGPDKHLTFLGFTFKRFTGGQNP